MMLLCVCGGRWLSFVVGVSQISQIEPDQDMGMVLRWFGCSDYASDAPTFFLRAVALSSATRSVDPFPGGHPTVTADAENVGPTARECKRTTDNSINSATDSVSSTVVARSSTTVVM